MARTNSRGKNNSGNNKSWRGVVGRFPEFSAQTLFSERNEMDVFYRQYNTYRILLSILGLWPYHKSIYSTIHRISISVIMFAYIVFEVLWLFKSGITFRGCIVTLSSTCPVVIYLMRYVTSVAVFPVVRDVLIWTLVQL
ncbi:uncharacterized protein [Bombus flavifrons]|uniref:uncharacterized protein n=1 Tax=Bombus flavifrons TaxID=103934 RepID=UPI0037044798